MMMKIIMMVRVMMVVVVIMMMVTMNKNGNMAYWSVLVHVFSNIWNFIPRRILKGLSFFLS